MTMTRLALLSLKKKNPSLLNSLFKTYHQNVPIFILRTLDGVLLLSQLSSSSLLPSSRSSFASPSWISVQRTDLLASHLTLNRFERSSNLFMGSRSSFFYFPLCKINFILRNHCLVVHHGSQTWLSSSEEIPRSR